jgi:hypothetical protein
VRRQRIVSLEKFLPCLLLTLAALPVARAQQSPNLSALVAEVSKPIEVSKVKSVAKFDFYGPGTSVSELGRSMADQFSAGLAKSSSSVTVIERDAVKSAIESNRFAPGIIADSEIALWLAQRLHAESAVIGRLSQAEGGLQLTLDFFKSKNGKMLGSFRATIPLTEALKILMEKMWILIPL